MKKRRLYLVFISSFLIPFSLWSQTFNGPLRVSKQNPRYFTDNTGQAIFLTGSHTWANFQEIGIANDSLFEWNKYLDMMQANKHNFMKLWVWEQAKLGSWTNEEIAFAPNCYQKLVENGKTKFDLKKWNQTYFDRLRSRVKEAGTRGIYVSVMLFQGWSQKKEKLRNPWLHHPFNPENNINGLGKTLVDHKEDDASMATLHSLKNGEILKLQEAYVQKIIETIGDQDNVLFEIINEGGTKEWQYHMINFIHKTESKLAKKHPVGMSHAVAVKPQMWNQDLIESPADWIAPSPEPFEWEYPHSSKTTDYQFNLKPNTSKRITILDTDHLWGCGGNYAWVWQAFLQGYNPIFMDPWQSFPKADTAAIKWLAPCLYEREYPEYVLIRQNMGFAKAYSQQINLNKVSPMPDLASSGYCLAETNKSYLVWVDAGKYLTLNLRNTNGTFKAEWFNPKTQKTSIIEPIKGGDFVVLKAPFESDAVLFLSKKVISK